MNERIRDLAEKAGYYIDPDFGIEFEVFAKLIIQECCSISDEAERADVPVLASKFIKAHFGVE